MYFATVDMATGKLEELRLLPMQSVRFRLTLPGAADGKWLEDTFNSIGGPLGTSIKPGGQERLELKWER